MEDSTVIIIARYIALFLLIFALLVVPTVLVMWFRRSVEHGLNPQHKMALKIVVDNFVKAAEQMYRSKEGQEKKRWVLEQMQEYADRQRVKIDMGLVAAMVEAVVLEAINGPGGIKAKGIQTALDIERQGGDARALPFVEGDAPVSDGPPPLDFEV